MAINESWHTLPTDYNGTGVDGVGQFFGAYPASVVPFAGPGMLMIIWIVSFVLSYMAGPIKAATVACFTSAVLGTYLWRMGLVSIEWIFVLAVLTIAGVLLSKSENSGL